MKTNKHITNPQARATYRDALLAARRSARSVKSTPKERVKGSPYFIIGYLAMALNISESEK